RRSHSFKGISTVCVVSMPWSTPSAFSVQNSTGTGRAICFMFLQRHWTEKGITPQEVISWGIEIPTMRALVSAACLYVDHETGVRLKFHTPVLHQRRRVFEELWSRVSGKLGE